MWCNQKPPGEFMQRILWSFRFLCSMVTRKGQGIWGLLSGAACFQLVPVLVEKQKRNRSLQTLNRLKGMGR